MTILLHVDFVRHSKGLWLEVCVTITYSLTENLPCDIGMQYTMDKIHHPNANFSIELPTQRT
jgi:hypothetical protein